MQTIGRLSGRTILRIDEPPLRWLLAAVFVMTLGAGAPAQSVSATERLLNVSPHHLNCSAERTPRAYLACLHKTAFPQINDPAIPDPVWQLKVIQFAETQLDASMADPRQDVDAYYFVIDLSVTGRAPRTPAFWPTACGTALSKVTKLFRAYRSMDPLTIPDHLSTDFSIAFSTYASSPCCLPGDNLCRATNLMGLNSAPDIVRQLDSNTQKDTNGEPPQVPNPHSEMRVTPSQGSDVSPSFFGQRKNWARGRPEAHSVPHEVSLASQ